MKILELNEYCKTCNKSMDYVKYHYEEWLDFHSRFKIVDEKTIEPFDFKNSLREYSFDTYFKPVYDKKHYVIYNDKDNNILLGIFQKEDDLKVNIIKSLIFSPKKWYKIIETIINFINGKYLIIDSHTIMRYHPFFEKLIRNINGNIINNLKNPHKTYVFVKKQKEIEYDNSFKIEIVGYTDYEKTKILFKHSTNFVIKKKTHIGTSYYFNDFEEKHKYNQYIIYLENPIIYQKPYREVIEIPLDLYITYNGEKYKIHSNKPYNLRFNLLDTNKNNVITNKDTNTDIRIVSKIKLIKRVCDCESCVSQLNEYKLEDEVLDIEKWFSLETTFEYHRESNKIIYDFIENNLLEYVKQTDFKKIKEIQIRGFKDYDFTSNEYIDFGLGLLFEEEFLKKIINPLKIKTIKKKDDKSIENEYNYVYLIQKIDANTGKEVYKFGKTSRRFNERLKEHCKTSKVIFVLEVDNCDDTERNILKILREDKEITERKDIGNEYFECVNKKYIRDLIIKNI